MLFVRSRPPQCRRSSSFNCRYARTPVDNRFAVIPCWRQRIGGSAQLYRRPGAHGPGQSSRHSAVGSQRGPLAVALAAQPYTPDDAYDARITELGG